MDQRVSQRGCHIPATATLIALRSRLVGNLEVMRPRQLVGNRFN